MSQTIDVNMTPGLFMPTIFYSQGDIGREFKINITTSDGTAIPAGATVKMQATKPSGLGFSVAGTLSGNVATFVTTETMTNEAGRVPAELVLEANGDRIGTANFYWQGEKDPHPQGTVDGDLDDVMPKYMTVTVTSLAPNTTPTYNYDPSTNTANFGIPRGADGSLSSGVLASTYSSSSIYAVGDYVYYNGSLYRCTTAITTAEAWTSGHWTQVALANDVSDLKDELSDIGVEENVIAVSAPRTLAYRIDGSGNITSAGGNYQIYKASVTASKKYLVSASNNWSGYFYAYYDSNMDLVELGTASASGSTVTSIEDEETVAPTGASYLVSVSVNEILDTPIREIDGYILPRLDKVVSDVSDLMSGVTLRNLFNPAKAVQGYYFNGSGILTSNANSEYYGEYIPIDPAETYIANADNLQVLTYTSDKTFIERAYNLEPAETAFSFGNSVAFVRLSRYNSAFPNGFIFATTRAYTLLTGTVGDKVGVATKTATSLTVTVGKLKVVVNKYNDATIRAYNLWRSKDGYINDGSGFKRLWYNSDSDGVVRIKDEDDFLGGYHGDETQTAFKLFVDGVEYAENATFTDLEFDELVLCCTSDVYHCNTSSTPNVVAFKRNKIITFNKDGYAVSNYWVAQENLVLTRAYMGMLSVERYTDNNYTDYLINGYHTNHNFAYTDADTASSDYQDLTEVLFNTIYGDVGMKITDVNTPSTYYGNVTSYDSANDKRLKAYFANINSNNGISVSQGAIIKAKATTFVR